MFNLLSFCSAWHGLYIYVYSFPVSWINFPEYWTECCSPSSFSVKTLWSPKTMLSIKFPEVWVSMTANTFCLCVLWKACITWHFWTTNRKLTFSWKITLQGAIPPLKTGLSIISLFSLHQCSVHESYRPIRHCWWFCKMSDDLEQKQSDDLKKSFHEHCQWTICTHAGVLLWVFSCHSTSSTVKSLI